MTALSVAQAVATYIGIEVPSMLVADTDREVVELREVISEMAQEIAFDSGHDWRILRALQSEAGDGATSAFDLPSDFRRLGVREQIWTTRLQHPLEVIRSVDRWLQIDIRDVDYLSGAWIRIGDQIQVKPTPEATETLKYYYLSDKIWLDNDGSTTRAALTEDTDVFRIDERVLKLGAIWRWRQGKGLDYAEDMQNYQRALAARVTDEADTRVLAVGRRRRPRGVEIAYPEALD